MKWARWCEQNNHEYQYIRGCTSKEKINFKPDKIYMSCIFSFNSGIYKKTIEYYHKLFPYVNWKVGGVFPTLYPRFFADSLRRDLKMYYGPNPFEVHCGMVPELENLTPKYNVPITFEDKDYPRDKIVMYASRGCVNKCGYCAVPRLEGDMRSFESIQTTLDSAREELPDAKSVVLYDNNFTEHQYLEKIVDELVAFGLPVDIHGLHVEAFTPEIAKQFERLTWSAQGESGTAYLRFSFDWMKYAPSVEKAYNIYMDHNIGAGFFCYMLFNWTDSPRDFWERIVKSQKIVSSHENGRPIFLFPQRYEPFKPQSKDKKLQGLKRNQYISPQWDKYVKENLLEKYPGATGADLVRGVTRMYTWVHGFLSVTKSENLFNWIGKDCNEFINRAMKMGTDKTYRLDKIQDKRDIEFSNNFGSLA